MKRGEVAVLYCKSNYAYGDNGSPPKIPHNAILVFVSDSPLSKELHGKGNERFLYPFLMQLKSRSVYLPR